MIAPKIVLTNNYKYLFQILTHLQPKLYGLQWLNRFAKDNWFSIRFADLGQKMNQKQHKIQLFLKPENRNSFAFLHFCVKMFKNSFRICMLLQIVAKCLPNLGLLGSRLIHTVEDLSFWTGFYYVTTLPFGGLLQFWIYGLSINTGWCFGFLWYGKLLVVFHIVCALQHWLKQFSLRVCIVYFECAGFRFDESILALTM